MVTNFENPSITKHHVAQVVARVMKDLRVVALYSELARASAFFLCQAVGLGFTCSTSVEKKINYCFAQHPPVITEELYPRTLLLARTKLPFCNMAGDSTTLWLDI